MPDRRAFLQISALLSLAAAEQSSAFMPLGAREISASKLVYDRRFGDSVSFARVAARGGSAIFAIERDVTTLWRLELERHWRSSQAPVGGLTQECSLFALEQLAWESQWQLVYRTDHALHDDGTVEHRCFATEAVARRIDAARGQWPAAIAQLLTRYPLTAQASAGCARRHPISRQTELLVSWLMLPRL